MTPYVVIDLNSSLVQIMACRLLRAKPLPLTSDDSLSIERLQLNALEI